MAGIKKETQRRLVVALPSGEPFRYDFRDTKPQTIQIQNFTGNLVYMSDTPDISTSLYDLVIVDGAKGNCTFPLNVDHVYLYAVAAGNIKLTSYENDEIYAADLDKNATVNIATSVVGSSIQAADGDITTLGAKADAADTDSTHTKSLMSFVKGIVSLIVSLTAKLPAALTGAGSLKVAVSEALPALSAGTNNIGDVDVLTLPSIPAGTNNIGDVDVLTVPANIMKATTPTIYNVSLSTADTEYSQALPAGTKKFSVSIIDGSGLDNFRIAFATGKVATPTAPYLKYSQANEYAEDNLHTSSTLYLASSVSSVVAQIVAWS